MVDGSEQKGTSPASTHTRDAPAPPLTRKQVKEIEELTNSIQFKAVNEEAKNETALLLLKAENREKELKREMKLLERRMENEKSRAARLAADVKETKETMK